MAKYRIVVSYEVEANNPEEALRMVNTRGAFSVNLSRIATAADDPLMETIMSADGF